ncbi:PREDICTED: uncharacterized protein LOC101297724 [Fragaria vesca subsp. vesca]
MVSERFTKDRYGSSQFEAGGYKWKLVLYPNGNKRRNVGNHISLYLVIADRFSSNWLGDAFTKQKCFNGAVLDAAGFDQLIHIKDFSDASNRYIVDDTCVYGAEINVAVTDAAGFDDLIPTKDFTDASNGYLVGDTCVYGADVFVCKERRTARTGIGKECVRKSSNAFVDKHVWKLDNFIRLANRLFILLLGTKIFGALKKSWGTGFHKFIALNMFSQADKGYFKNDTCVVEAEVTVRGTTGVPV